jgi:hypothetical protein
MLCGLLLAAVVATGPALQEVPSPRAHETPSAVRPSGSKKPFARLFRLESDDPKTGVAAPHFRTVPDKRAIRADDGTLREDESVDVICGTTVVRKSPRIDPGIALQANRGTGIAVRRAEPQVCGAGRVVVPK